MSYDIGTHINFNKNPESEPKPHWYEVGAKVIFARYLDDGPTTVKLSFT